MSVSRVRGMPETVPKLVARAPATNVEARPHFVSVVRRLARIMKTAAKETRDVIRASVREARWLSARNRIIDNYLQVNAVRKLHLGCGPVVLDGWLNADLRPRREPQIFVDVTEPLPFKDAVFDYIFAENLLGDLTYSQARSALLECRRVLKPGGRIRVATPSLAKLAELYAPNRGELHERYITWAIENWVGWADARLEGLIINNLFQEHRFAYDPAILRHVLERIGYVDVVEEPFGMSNDPHLVGIDSHGRVVGNQDVGRFESVTMEARRG